MYGTSYAGKPKIDLRRLPEAFLQNLSVFAVAALGTHTLFVQGDAAQGAPVSSVISDFQSD